MAKILVAYATVEGQTRKIAEFVADTLSRRRNAVKLLDLAASGPDVDVADYDAVIVAASVHLGRHNAPAAAFVGKRAGDLGGRPSALISVSLHAASAEPADREEARGYADNLCAETGWLPRAVFYAGGALRFAKYDFFKKMAVRSLAKERGIAVEKDGDLELTDWRALAAFLDEFLRDHVPAS